METNITDDFTHGGLAAVEGSRALGITHQLYSKYHHYLDRIYYMPMPKSVIISVTRENSVSYRQIISSLLWRRKSGMACRRRYVSPKRLCVRNAIEQGQDEHLKQLYEIEGTMEFELNYTVIRMYADHSMNSL